MKGKLGVSTQIYGKVLPGIGRLARIKDVKPSKEAKRRLKWIDYYQTKGKNARATCRHFDISPSLFYKWYNRFHKQGVRGLENLSKWPKKLRQSSIPIEHVDLIRKLRRQYPYYSKYKLEVILKRDCQVKLSASSIGRIIKKYDMFFNTPYPKKKDRHKYKRKKLPKGFRASQAGELVQADTKHISFFGPKRYLYVLIDSVTKMTSIHVTSSPSSHQAKVALQKAQERFPYEIKSVMTDNGPENLKDMDGYLVEEKIAHYFTRPRTPQDNAYVERMIGTIEREFIEQGKLAFEKEEQQRLVDEWLEEYHSFRPHQSLGYLTPNQFYATLSSNPT